MSIKTVKIKNPESLNIILGQSHFIKTVEDLYEALAASIPGIKFGLAFSEASGPCLVRKAGTDKQLEKLAAENILKIGAGHAFLIILKNCFPINVLRAIKKVDEVVNIFCATANPLEVVLYEKEKKRAIIGVIDGAAPKGIEKEKDVQKRKDFLRQIGYKL